MGIQYQLYLLGSIDKNGQGRQTQPPAQRTSTLNNSVSPRRKKSAPNTSEKRAPAELTPRHTQECMVSTTSSDTWSMCSGSSEGSGSNDVSKNILIQIVENFNSSSVNYWLIN